MSQSCEGASFRAGRFRLKLNSDRQLNPPGAVGAVRRSVGLVDGSKRIRAGDIQIRLTRIGEVRVIEDVEEIGGELDVQALRDERVLADAEIEVFVGKTGDRIRATATAIATDQNGTEVHDVGL